MVQRKITTTLKMKKKNIADTMFYEKINLILKFLNVRNKIKEENQKKRMLICNSCVDVCGRIFCVFIFFLFYK